MPGFWLDSVDMALSIIDEVSAPNLLRQFDIYHAQRSGGEIAGSIERNLGRIGHIQFADNPRRNEPGTGELNFGYLFALIDRLGYPGWVGAEYGPPPPRKPGAPGLAPRETGHEDRVHRAWLHGNADGGPPDCDGARGFCP